MSVFRLFGSTTPLSFVLGMGLVAGCPAHSRGVGPADATLTDAKIPDAATLGAFCALPGSVIWQNGAPGVLPGGPSTPDLTWMHLPDGFCAHFYANVPEARLLRFSPGGELFVSSPSAPTAGGAAGGLGAVVVLPEDKQNGAAASTIQYLTGLPRTQGLLFTGGYLYYQDDTLIRRTPYKEGDRAATLPGETVIDVNVYQSTAHWPRAIDIDDLGNIYVTNGGDEGLQCDPSMPSAQRPFQGGILRIDGSPHGELIAKGLRNPIALRCAPGTHTCFGLELARDFAAAQGSREKLFAIRKGDDWGFPCCASAGRPFSDIQPPPDCANVVSETTSFIIDHTPFGLDFEVGAWPGLWKKRTFVALHGVFGSWAGARVVALETDRTTGWPIPSAEANPNASFVDFATGWDDGQRDHGRPAALTFAPDGRLFLADDILGAILWVAPFGSPTAQDAGVSIDASSDTGASRDALAADAD